jgi:hypothetical protein
MSSARDRTDYGRGSWLFRGGEDLGLQVGVSMQEKIGARWRGH